MEFEFDTFKRKFYGYLIIGLLAAASHINSLNGTFVFDDAEVLLNNEDILPGTPIGNVFKNDYWGTDLKSVYSHKSYRPITILSFRLNYALCDGFDPRFFHLVNVILHVIISCLSWPVFLQILGENKVFFAFLGAILFSVHPVHSEAVCGVVGRADLLCALFFFLSFLAFSKSNAKKFRDWIWLSLSVILAGISMFCKEQGVTIIGILCVYDVLILHEISVKQVVNIFYNMFKKDCQTSQTLRIIRRQSFLLASAIILIWFRCYQMNFENPTFQKVDNPASFEKEWLTRVLTYNYIFSLNFWILLCPEWLCFDWSMGCVPIVTVSDLRVVFVLLFWLCFACVVWKALTVNPDKQKIIILSLLLLIVPFLPASNLLFTVGFVVAERVLYIPSAGFCLLVAFGVEMLAQSFPAYKNDIGYAYTLLILIFLARSLERSHDWNTEETLYNSGAKVCPLNAKVHYNIAQSAVENGDTDKAVREYREAIRLFPEYDQALNNLANILKSKGQMKEAEALLRKALRIRDTFPAAWMNLGIVLAQTKRFKEAFESYSNALKYRKHYPDCYFNMGNLFLEEKRHEDAEKAWLMATKLKPTFSMAWSNLIILSDSRGNLTKAVEFAEEALQYLPDDPAIHFNLANALGKQGQFVKSEKHFITALKKNPKNPQYHLNLGVLYHRWQKYRRAEECYRRALKISPNLKNAKDNYDLLKKKLNDD